MPANSKYKRVSENWRYRVWLAMVRRCTKPEHHAWARYGGRGINVCDRWIESFEAFVDDMGERPTPQHTIDRVDNDRGYSPNNCRWATRSEQAHNRRPAAEKKNIIRVDGLSLTALAKKYGVNRGTLKYRWRLGKRGAALVAKDLRQQGGMRWP